MHPELVAEQDYVDRAYAFLEAARDRARELTGMVQVGRGGTNQARFEREAIWDAVAARLDRLEMGDAALVFGRIDQEADGGGDGTTGGGRYYIGRVGVWDDDQEPVVVDWRAPVAEAFYRATGRMPMGLERRRHFVSRGRELLAIEDELFGDVERFRDGDGLRGEGALIAALETARTGRLGDIVGTIQAEQDLVIRAPMPGVLAVQGGPGTGKTVVALHRAAYLLYTNRFPLEGQGVLVVGPNRLFLAYIEQVLPSLGEAGIELATLSDVVGGVRVDDRHDAESVSRLKGDLRMVRFVARAARTRQRSLRRDLRVGYGVQWLRITVEETERIVAEARRRFRTHNAARRYVEQEFFSTLAESARADLDPGAVRERLRGELPVREALEWMWPVMTPAQLLNDLFGSRALLRAADSSLTADDVESLFRPRAADVDNIRWSASDAPLLDEARAVLGPRPGRREQDAVRTYGHIVVDEVQDLSPMELRMLERRSLNGSMTVVGDIAQATGAWAHDGWESILDHLPDKRPSQRHELTVGYRIPGPLMDLAGRVLAVAVPDLTPPVAVRGDGEEPRFVAVEDVAASVAEVVSEESAAVEKGNVAVIVAASQVAEVEAALEAAGVEFGRPTRRGLDAPVAVVPVTLVKGLEVDAAVVVEPARIVAEQVQGLRALYVALTRATRRVAVVHAEPLPEALTD
ncbi:MAG: AAA family ATPase [Acidimicrobiaceae bacterium]|nr:AAA family ATPase [Acidimicrobiaceae bacterium]